MRLCPDLPPPLQQQVQHRKQQHAHSAPQHMQRAMHVRTEMRMREPMIMPTMTGHLVVVSCAVCVCVCVVRGETGQGTTYLQYTLAMQVSHEEKVLRALLKGSCRAQSEGIVARGNEVYSTSRYRSGCVVCVGGRWLFQEVNGWRTQVKNATPKFLPHDLIRRSDELG